MSTERLLTRIIPIIFLGFIIIFALFPFYWMLSSSLKPPQELFTIPPRLVPRNLSVVWFREVLVQTRLPRYFLNSLIIASSTMVINIIVSTLGAYSLTRFHYRGRKVILLAVLFSYIFPPVLLLLPLYLTLSKLALIDTYFGVIITHMTFTIPFSLWLLRSFFMAIPKDLEEAARVDGLTRGQAFARIVLPLAAPGILSTGIFSFIMSWNEYLYASVLLTGDIHRTVPIGIAEFIAQYDVRWGAIMASATLATIPVLLLFVMIQRHFVRGLMAGAVKG